MIRIVHINSLVKQRVKEMVHALLPEVGYVKVTNSGLVTLKKRWWSVQRVQTTVTDLVVGVLPKKIAEMASLTEQPNYSRVFNEHIAMIMSLNGYSTQFDVCTYVWEQYLKYCMTVPTTITNRTTQEQFVLQQKNYLPIPVKMSSRSISDLFELITNTTASKMSKRFITKLNRMKWHLPAPIIKHRLIFAFS